MTRHSRPLTFASATVAMALAASPVLAELQSKTSPKSVSETVDALAAAVEEAGATVIARVDHAGSAASVDMELAESELLIFGNPKVGTPPMQDDPRVGLMLPLRVLTYLDGEGTTRVVYENSAALFEGLEVPQDAEYLTKIDGALDKLTDKAIAD
ncbi:DUF302 domain-containing protein [Oceaniglobus trochenteri]|uniref:DUF302 domain-containing protein n=1 Tax=Oceaniglobus trochenteri TaxID=2763260 RepID=UPI001CFF65EF|nr:DUF302 domain-containing protein [Oceaniglobus trochenteri]